MNQIFMRRIQTPFSNRLSFFFRRVAKSQLLLSKNAAWLPCAMQSLAEHGDRGPNVPLTFLGFVITVLSETGPRGYCNVTEIKELKK